MHAKAKDQDTKGFAVELRNIRKAYGSCVSNRDVSLKIPRGTIQGILGENGAGKSTAMKILYGLVEPDSGEVWINGKRRDLHSAQQAKSLGIGMVHQHFMLSESQSVLENIILGEEPRFRFLKWLPRALQPIDHQQARLRLASLMATHGLEVPLDRLVRDLSVGARQRVEILKLLYVEAQILILDEPTAVLTPHEVEQFFKQLRALADAGKTILIVTHKLHELLAVTDAISILRAGSTIAHVKTSEIDADGLAALMIGRRREQLKSRKEKSFAQNPILKLSDLQLGPQRVKGDGRRLSLELHPGEILGLAGIEGNGQHELVEALRHPRGYFRLHKEGAIEFKGQDVRKWKSTQMVLAGLGTIPSDRHHEGLLLNRSALHNFLLGHQMRAVFRWGPFLRWSAIERITREGMAAFAVVPLNPGLELRRFSGGNQQKLIIAREVAHHPDLLIAFHPTRGVDIGAIELIHRTLLDLRAKGLAILLISSELDEILALSDRIAVIENFSIAKTFEGDACDETALGLAMSGASAAKTTGDVHA